MDSRPKSYIQGKQKRGQAAGCSIAGHWVTVGRRVIRDQYILGSAFWVSGSGFWVLGSAFWVPCPEPGRRVRSALGGTVAFPQDQGFTLRCGLTMAALRTLR